MGAEQLRPPVADARRTGERMTDQNGVIAALIQAAVDRVTQVDRPQRAAGFERERLVPGETEIAFLRRLDRLLHRSNKITEMDVRCQSPIWNLEPET